MVTPTVTTKVNNSNYDVSADQWNALIAAVKNQVYSYIVYKSGSTYYARNGATGAVDYSETTLADALTEAFTALTAGGGVIFLSQLAFPMASFASIPEGVRVVCDYEAEHWEYINSADSVGSPYTVSVGSGVNVGYYLAQDCEGRICYSDVDCVSVINSAITAANVAGGGTVFLRSGEYRKANYIKIYMKSNVDLIGEQMVGVVIGSTGSYTRISYAGEVANCTLSNFTFDFYDGATSGIDIAGTTHDIVCEKIKFESTDLTRAFYVASLGENIVIRDCISLDDTVGYFILGDLRSGSRVERNYVKDAHEAIHLYSAQNCLISENIFVDCADYEYKAAIFIGNSHGESYGVNIVDNLIRFTKVPDVAGDVNAIVVSAEAGDGWYPTYDILVSGNNLIAEQEGYAGGYLNAAVYCHGRSGEKPIDHVVIEGNIMFGPWDRAIITSYAQNIDIKDNTITDAIMGLYIGAGQTGNTVRDNTFTNCTTAVDCRSSSTEFSDNAGFVTENKGTGSIESGSTSDVIAHGCSYTPDAADIVITLTENPTNTPGAIWVDTIGAATFTVNCENDPGASNLDFSWAVRKV